MRPFLLLLLLAATGCTALTPADMAWRIDPDGDGVEFPFDCDDTDPDAGTPLLRWLDADGDGEGAAGDPTEVCHESDN